MGQMSNPVLVENLSRATKNDSNQIRKKMEDMDKKLNKKVDGLENENEMKNDVDNLENEVKAILDIVSKGSINVW